jgi:hypothetical protein
MAESPNYVLMTVECAEAKPRIASAAAALSVPVSAIDAKFGVVAIDPLRHLFAVQVLSSAIAPPDKDRAFSGPFANPRIETFE